MIFLERLIVFVFTGCVVALWMVLIGWTIKSTVRWRKELRAPVEIIPVVITKCYEKEGFVYQFQKQVVASHHADFLADDGREFSFWLTPVQYRAMETGDSGLLRVRNGDFVSFESQVHTGQRRYVGSADAERVYQKIVRGK